MAGGEARQLAALSLRHLHAGAVTLVLVGGLPGTGKSALSAAVADRLGCTVLNSDRIRKELAGLPAARKAPALYEEGIYTPSWTERTYRELLHRAAELLSHGESVIADASWISAGHRAGAVAVAGDAAADLVQLRCTAPAELTPRRMSTRMSTRTGGASDACPMVAEKMAAAHAPWPEAVSIDTSAIEPPSPAAAPADPLQRALETIRPRVPAHPWRPVLPYMLPE